MDSGAWQATVQADAKNWTLLSLHEWMNTNISWVFYISNLLLYICNLLILTITLYWWNYYYSCFTDEDGREVTVQGQNAGTLNQVCLILQLMLIILSTVPVHERCFRDQLLAVNQKAEIQNVVWESLLKSMSVFKSKTIKSTGSYIPQWRRIRATFHKVTWNSISILFSGKKCFYSLLHTTPYQHEIFWNKQIFLGDSQEENVYKNRNNFELVTHTNNYFSLLV